MMFGWQFNVAFRELEEQSLAIFSKQMGSLFSQAETADMTVSCQGEEVPCHRAILMARSPTFARGLTTSWKEGGQARWEVREAAPGAVRD